MKYYKVDELKKVFFDYFVNNCGYKQIKGSSLVPSIDNSVLFTPAGMYPLIPYLSGESNHPNGNKLVNIQNVIRTGALNKVGDDFFLTFFELFGNWVIGEYDKKEVLSNVLQFLTSNLDISVDQIYMTYFDGNDIYDKDLDTFELWKKIGVSYNHLCPTNKNWKGPYSYEKICGPNTRIFYDTMKEKCSCECNVTCNCGKYVELWDIVFFDYKLKDGKLEKNSTPSVDMGAGVERIAALIQNTNTIYETDKLNKIVNAVELHIEDENKLSSEETRRKCRIIADHLRCLCLAIGDEISTIPSNKGRGYVLRKILRRTINVTDQLGISFESYKNIINVIIDLYKKDNPQLENKREFILNEIYGEYILYKTSLKNNLIKVEKELIKREYITDSEIEKLFDRYGVPLDIIKDVVVRNKILIKSLIKE